MICRKCSNRKASIVLETDKGYKRYLCNECYEQEMEKIQEGKASYTAVKYLCAGCSERIANTIVTIRILKEKQEVWLCDECANTEIEIRKEYISIF